MKKTLTTQNSAYLKLNESLSKINNEENQNKQTNDQYTKINHNELQDNLKEKMQPLIESIPIEIIKKIESQTNQICEVKEFQNQENINNSKIIIKDKNEISNLDQDIYSFSTREINDELQNVSYIYNIFLCYFYVYNFTLIFLDIHNYMHYIIVNYRYYQYKKKRFDSI